MEKCHQCGMTLEKPTEYHPFAACLMFEACHNSKMVRENLRAVINHGVRHTLERQAIIKRNRTEAGLMAEPARSIRGWKVRLRCLLLGHQWRRHNEKTGRDVVTWLASIAPEVRYYSVCDKCGEIKERGTGYAYGSERDPFADR